MTLPIIGSGTVKSVHPNGTSMYGPNITPSAEALAQAFNQTMHWAQFGNASIFDMAYSTMPTSYHGCGEMPLYGAFDQPSVWFSTSSWVTVGEGYRHIPAGFNAVNATLSCKVPHASSKTQMHVRLMASHSQGVDTTEYNFNVNGEDAGYETWRRVTYRDALSPGFYDNPYVDPFRGTMNITLGMHLQNVPTGTQWGDESPRFVLEAYAASKGKDDNVSPNRFVPIGCRARFAIDYASSGSSTPEIPAPADWMPDFALTTERGMHLRQYSNLLIDLLQNLALPENEEQRKSTYAEVTAHCMLSDINDDDKVADMTACFVTASQLDPPMPIYPAYRVFPAATFDKWVDVDYWTSQSNDLDVIAAFRNDDDLRIGIDAEAYTAGSEPTPATLATNGYTVDQFNTAVEPWIAKMEELLATGSLATGTPCGVVIYPQVQRASDGYHCLIARLLERLGRDRVEVCWYRTFNAIENRRKDLIDWKSEMYDLFLHEKGFEKNMGMGPLRHRHVIDDDIFRMWGSGTDILTEMGPVWVYDRIRTDRDSWGTVAAYSGTTMSDLNNVQYVWHARTSDPNGMWSVGTEEARQFKPYWGVTGSIVARTTMFEEAGDGILMGNPGTGNNTSYSYDMLRLSSLVKGDEWTLHMDGITLPKEMENARSFMGCCNYNFASWVLQYVTGDIYVCLNGSPDVHLKLAEDVVTGSAPFGFTLSVSGTTFAFSTGSGDITRVDIGQTPSNFTVGTFAMGAATTASFADAKMYGCPGLRWDGQCLLWKRYLESDDDFDETFDDTFPYGD